MDINLRIEIKELIDDLKETLKYNYSPIGNRSLKLLEEVIKENEIQ